MKYACEAKDIGCDKQDVEEGGWEQCGSDRFGCFSERHRYPFIEQWKQLNL